MNAYLNGFTFFYSSSRVGVDIDFNILESTDDILEHLYWHPVQETDYNFVKKFMFILAKIM